ncbi:MAG: hypothetical protein HQK97_06565 [Nitrospirae bacterium]|nr:hypothetical protein [Nitrospirota bacterium]
MKSSSAVIILLIIALTALNTHVTAADEHPTATFQTGSVNGIDYIAGGVGDDDRDALEAIARAKYNLKLIFATNMGSYLADIPVEITGKGGKKLIEAVSSGPLFFVKLPVGTYTIKATFEGKEKTQKIKATNAKQQAVFTWLIPTL